jgi:hypothetical protein
MTSINTEPTEWAELVDEYVEDHYGSILPGQHRDTVKALVLGTPTVMHCRPYLLAVLQRVAHEVQAVLAAQRPN